MVYYAAFLVDIESVTYRYPDKVRVTYEPIDTSMPDLIPTELQATTPAAVGTPTTFQYKIKNLGKSTNPTGFTIRVTDTNSGITIYSTTAGPLAKDAVQTGTFTYTFPASGAREFELFVDANNEIDEGAFENNNKLRATFTVSTGITGDFDVIPATINYKDPFKLVPKNIATTAGCTYTEHTFRMVNSSTWTSPKQTSPTQELSFNHPGHYPAPISVGTVTVGMKLKGTCGETNWIEKTLTVNGPTSNNPPYFRLGWFSTYDNIGKIPYTQALIGSVLQVRTVEDPPSPSDPDHDPIWINGWDFNRSTNWVQTLPGFYGFGQQEEKLLGILASTLGTHTVYATMTDPFGGTFTAPATVEVIPYNPIAQATCPQVVKENRPIEPNSFKADGSYSPVGRQINHTLDEWTNKQASYLNGTTSDIQTQVSLHVWDNGIPALKSLNPSVCNITVKPDLPPIGKLDTPPYGIRNQGLDLFNKSYSPDGDVIVSTAYKYKYDTANDGFTNDNWIAIPGNMTKTTFTPPRVGKYLFEVTVCEDFGQCGSATTTQLATSLTMDTLNLAPQVSFQVLGQNVQPEVNLPLVYPVSTILNSWNLYKTNTNTLIADKGSSWELSGNALAAGMGRNFENPFTQTGLKSPLADLGYGNNGLSPYRAGIGGSIRGFPILVPDPSSTGGWAVAQLNNTSDRAKYQTNPKYIYFVARNQGGNKVYAYNKSRIGNYGYYYNSPYDWYHTLDVNPYDFIIDVTTIGNLCNCGPNGTPKNASPSIAGFELADRTLYVAVEWSYAYNTGSTDSDGNEIWDMTKVMGIVSYDAFTGQKLGMSDRGLPGANYNYQMFKRGDKIRYVGTNPYDASPNNIYEFNRYGQLVSTIPLNQLTAPPNSGNYVYKMNFSEFFKDGDGSQYRYEYITSTFTGNTNYFAYNESYIVKYRATDMGIAWRKKLAGGMPGWWINNGVNSQIVPDNTQRKIHVLSSSQSPNVNYAEALDMDTGASTGGSDYRYGGLSWSGNYVGISTSQLFGSTGAEGYYGSYEMYSSTPYIGIKKPDGSYASSFQVGSWSPGNAMTAPITHAAPQYFGGWAGDGLYLTAHGQTVQYRTGGDVFFLNVLTPSSDPLLGIPTQLGQFVSPFTLDNSELAFSMKMLDPVMDNRMAGLSFRMQDPMNRYAVETDGTTLYVSRYVNGSRAVLQSIAYPFQGKQDYALKVKMVGSQLDVSLNGIPYLSVTDGTFTNGRIGPVTDKSFVDFQGLSSKVITSSHVEWLSNYAIWESGTAMAQVQYQHLNFDDPENDPVAGSFLWSFTHTPKFMNNQGVSGLDGSTRASEQLIFDKVGEYWITLRARDDPNPGYLYPSLTFEGYRQNSNAFQQKVIAHRRPVAAFAAVMNGDGSLTYSDSSYDPDRWVNVGSYSPSDTTGINYGTTRGIMERKYFYISPSGGYAETKLTRPTELGVYTIGLTVRDEYGAWSAPATQTVSTGILPAPNNKPSAALTFPYGTPNNPNMVYTARPTITWNQYDTAGTYFAGYHVVIRDENGQLVAESGESPQYTTANAASWAVPADLPIGVKLQAQVHVNDGEIWSDWSNVGWLQVNSPPTAVLTYPSGSRYSPSIIQENRRPTVQFVQADLDPGTIFQGGHIEIRDGSGVSVYSSAISQYTYSSMQSVAIACDLPTGVPLQVVVKTGDGVLESEWSNIGWMLINSRPTAQVTFPLGTYANPGVGGLRPLIEFRLADPEPGTLFSQYQIWIGREDGSEVLSYTQSGVFAQMDYGYQVGSNLPAGLKLQVLVRGWDQYGLDSAWSPVQWFLTNRPPVPAFDWSPKPVWEGDLVTFINQSADPDGDALSHGWVISNPDGSLLTTSTVVQPTQRFIVPGTYSVRLSVADVVESRSVTHAIPVQELTIGASVSHTPQWLSIHEERGHNTTAIPVDFYSGERFQLEVTTSSAQVESVTASIRTAGLDGEELEVAGTLLREGTSNTYRGELFDPRFLSVTEGLPEGELPVHFEVRYSNGIVKSTDVPVRIIGNAVELVSVHRQR